MAPDNDAIDNRLHWYKDAIIYELHIKAFMDGNGDGVGDFQGLLGKLGYLKDLGVTAIWLLPFYPSPLRDDGYDIADYYTINTSYGNIGQFRKLLKEAHRLQLKVITELVINHTSDQHPWFQRARKASKGSPLREYYVWSDDPAKYKDVRIIFQDFEVSNWMWDEDAQQYYWHRFFRHQPDLNYDNPLVQEEVFKIIDYWCNMGVDGFRLDAVPYLFEREGTNGENLPETHAFLKKLRKHVDDRFPGTLLLAEANMWPEDSAAYFGDGDECHMNYHFPVMPRMFMALQMEDRYPITDIFDQTPAIPHTCQWAIFLRNHDELTLEMVTDEERDYMYKVYVKDPMARINLGIRHRLAPLMNNNRRKIELLNYLLFSLPGTPVLYYGDEIGMGDNFYLGDRDGVRTPMQWSPDRNAGFSYANPQKLYLPVIHDPAYHYESVNVEMQQQNPSSLLWWTKRVISVRKKYKAFSRGDMQFVSAENSKVLAFTRSYEDETILVVVNLSRFSQPAELNLENHKGNLLVDVFSKNKFPAIKEETPYFFTLGPHAYHWFILQKAHPEIDEEDPLPLITVHKWKDLLTAPVREQLEENVIPEYLMKVRWYGGKARNFQGIRIADHFMIPMVDNSAVIFLVEVAYESGLPDMYQLSIAFAANDHAHEIYETFPQAVISRLILGEEEGILFDALYATEFQQIIFSKIASSHSFVPRKGTEIQFSGSKLLKTYFKEHERIKSRVLSADHSNTSIVYDNAFFLKFYRKVDRAINPDVEVSRFFSKHRRFRHVPAFQGTIEWKHEKNSVILGMVQEFIENNGDLWTYMLDRLVHFNERILSQEEANLPPMRSGASVFEPISYLDIPQEIIHLMEGPVIEQARLLGVRTGEMHLALGARSDLKDFQPEEYSLHYQRSIFASLKPLVRASFQNLTKSIKGLPEESRSEAKEVLNMMDEILNEMKKVYRKKIDIVKIRIHGDYHLGQVLFTGKDLVIMDFEGEPSRSYSERRIKRSPLRDVASMVRSFHYVVYGGLFLNNQVRKEDINRVLPYSEMWHNYMSGIFMQAYMETVDGHAFIPKDKEDLDVLMRTFLLEKAVYELNYELNSRPDWVIVPLKGIKAIMQGEVSVKV